MATGRIRRRRLDEVLDALPAGPAGDPECPLCGRPIPKSQQDAHHLLPKSRGGRATTLLHRICHRQVHALLSETELARDYASAEALRAHPEVAKFIAWVKTKPPEFSQRARKSARRR
jgi:5-methylcytosine-specific restriction endonuclease McrA